MNRQEKSQRFILTIFFSTVVFIALIISLVITGLIFYFLNRFGVLLPVGNSLDSMGLILLMMGFSLVLGTLVTAIIIRVPLKPINSLLNGMRKLSQGDYKARINIGLLGKHHVGYDLVDAFNTLAAELESTEMLRSDFINNFSHEFKTPIVSIAGFTKLLKHGELSDEQRVEYLDIIESESLRLSEMATNVLNLTKVENQNILTELSRYNLAEQLRTCVLMLEGKWARKNIEPDLELDELTVYANEELLKQVWLNLIDNAIKFSPEGGRVSIKLWGSSESVRVSVENEGPEISAENRKKIFNKFYQADESHSGEGNGIGLAIVKKIVELHGGITEVESREGINTFTVSLQSQSAKNAG